MKKSVMLDLETFDTIASAVVLSIGACRFDEFGIYDQFYVVCGSPDAREDQAKRGRTISESTVEWWSRQSEEARQILYEGPNQLTPLQALREFAQYLGASPIGRVWGNAPTFDNEIIRSMLRTYELPQLWHFRDDACFRTLKGLVKVKPPEREGTHHNALDDAIHQAKHAALIANRLGISIAEPF